MFGHICDLNPIYNKVIALVLKAVISKSYTSSNHANLHRFKIAFQENVVGI